MLEKNLSSKLGGLSVLSLFDGIPCGMVALERVGIPVKRYVAFEIDQYALQVSKFNYPEIEQCGDVFDADFKKYRGFDLLIGGSPCFTKGHLVLTDKGYKDISEIQIGDMVLTHKNRFRPVIRLNNRQAKTVQLKVMGYPIFTTTENHPFYTIHRHKNTYSEYLQFHTWRGFSKTPKWKQVSQLNKDDFCGQHIFKSNSNDNKFGLDEEDCFVLGRYVADGHLRKTPRKNRKNSFQYQVVLSIGSKKLNDFQKRIKKYHYSCYPHSDGVHRCVISSMDLLNFIEQQQFGKGAFNKNIPEFMFDLPNNLKKAFLDGYVGGDGCFVEKSKAYYLSTVSPKLAFSLQRFITSLCETNVGVTISNNNRSHEIDERVIKSNYPLYIICYKEEIRKQTVAHIQNNIIWTQVKTVQPTNLVETVYNIEVAEDNSYTVNNCIVHNCTYWSVAKGSDNRETIASGLGWDLFSQYVRALKESECPYFLYENNVSMSDEIKECISHELGCEAILIDSADFSAQKRQRYYWTNIPIKAWQPKNILFSDIIDDEYELSRSIAQFKNTYKWSKDGMCLKWDTSGKGYYSQQNRAKKINQKWNTVCANRAECKGNVWLGDDMIRAVTMSELEKLQTIPVGYTSCLKNKEQRGKCIGNGWTVDVIVHIFKGLLAT